MRKLLILLLILFASTSYAQIGGSGVALSGVGTGTTATSCTPQTMGYTDSGSSTSGLPAGGVATMGVTAPTFTSPCDGTLKTAHIINKDARTDNTIKVCVYNDADVVGTPDSSDTLVACSNTITGTATNPETLTASFSSGQVTSGGKYRITVANDNNSGGDFGIKYNANTADMEGNDPATDCSTFFDSPPENLNCTWGANLNRQLNVWIDVE